MEQLGSFRVSRWWALVGTLIALAINWRLGTHTETLVAHLVGFMTACIFVR